MALYRENATGFLCEYASNPGAGYTAISAMPTGTIANRVTWWRGLDTYGQTSSWHPSEYRSPEDPAEAALTIQFTREAAFISADPDGTVTDAYLGANTKVRVYRGSSDVTITEGWTLTKVEDGCASTLTQSGGVYTLAITSIPLLATTQGYVRITATRLGVSIAKDFRFLKVFRGADGADGSSGIVIDLSNEAHVIPTDADGNGGVFTGATSTATIYLGTSDDSANWTWAAPGVSAGVTGTASGGNRTYTVSGMSSDTGTVTFSASRSGYATQTAVFSLSKAKGGVAYSITASAAAINKLEAGTYNPASVTFSGFKTSSTSGRAAYAGRFIVATQDAVGGAWTTRYTSAGNEASYAYTIPAGVVSVRGSLYLAGGTSTLLDEEILPVVSDGATGNWTSYVFKESATQPSTPTGTATIPSGWLDAPPSGATNPVWMSKAAVNGGTGQAGTWSTPVKVTGVDGANGSAGADGTYVVFQYAKNTSATTAPTTGWASTPPALSAGEYMWMRSGTVVPPASTPSSWGAGYRVSGEKGDTGATGPAGAAGATGATGTRGSRQILVTTADGAWSDTTAWNGIVSQTGTSPVPSDLVTIAKTDGSVATSKFYVSGGSPGTWTTPTAYINGNLLVTGTVGANQIAANSITADRIDSRNLTIKDASGNIILGVGTPLNSSYIASGAANLVRSLALWTANSPNYIVSGESAAVDGESVVYPNTSTATAVSPTFPLFGGYAYSVSLKAWAYSGTRNITVRLINSSGGGVLASKVVTLTTDFTRIELNYTPGSNYTAYMQVYCASGSTTVQIADAKTELGATMTPWTPHSSDVVGTANPVTNSNITTYIANAAIDTAQIKDLAITSAKIDNATITSANIANATITGAKIASATITDANISSLSASKINAGTLSANYISGGTINGTNVTVTNLSATNITGGTLSVDRIAANSISGGKITVGGVDTTNIASGAISWIDSKGRVHSSPLSQTTTSGVEIEIAQSTLPSNADRGKVLITCLLDVASPSYGAAPTQVCNLFIYRGGTLLDYQGISVVSQYYHQMALSFVDTSAPTSATTYYFKWKWTTGASGCLVAGSITLMELKR